MLKLRVSGWPRLKGGWDCQPLPFRLPPHILSFNITYSNVQPLIAILCVRLGWVCVCVCALPITIWVDRPPFTTLCRCIQCTGKCVCGGGCSAHERVFLAGNQEGIVLPFTSGLCSPHFHQPSLLSQFSSFLRKFIDMSMNQLTFPTTARVVPGSGGRGSALPIAW